MKEEFLESLAQLEQNLKKLDSARTMVEQTVNAYKDLSVDFKSYTKSLSETCTAIQNLIGELKTNKDNISANINSELQSVISNFEAAVTIFNNSTTGLQKGFETQSRNLVFDLSSDMTRVNGQFEQTTNDCSNEFTKNTKNIIEKFATAIERFTQEVDSFNKENEAKVKAIHSEYLAIMKAQKYQRILLYIIGSLSLCGTILLLFNKL